MLILVGLDEFCRADYAKAESDEVRRLKKRVAELEQERDFLKKATAYFAKADK